MKKAVWMERMQEDRMAGRVARKQDVWKESKSEGCLEGKKEGRMDIWKASVAGRKTKDKMNGEKASIQDG